jgi:hypothetical protein
MPTSVQPPDSHQHTGAMLEEKLDMIAQIEEDWLKIDNRYLENNTHDSTSVRSGESDGLKDLEQGEISPGDETIEDEHQDKSSDKNTHESTSVKSSDSEELQDLEHCELLPWDKTIKIQQHDKTPDNNTQDSTPENTVGHEVLRELEQGDLPTGGDSNEHPQHGRDLDNNTQDSTPEDPRESEGLEEILQSGISRSVEMIEDHQHDKSSASDSPTTVHQVWYRYGKTSVAPMKRGLDENGNLIPLPPATPPLEVSRSHDLPLGLIEKIVVSSPPAVASSSKSTASSASVHGGRKRPADHSWSVGASPRRPYRISKAWKGPGAAGVPLGVEDGAKSAQVTKCIMNEPGECATHDTVNESRETEDHLEIADVAGSSHDFDKPVEEDKSDVPVTDDSENRHVGNDDAANFDVKAGTMDAQHPREDTVPGDVAERTVSETEDLVNELNDRAQDNTPKRNYLIEENDGVDGGEGLDAEAENIDGQQPREDIVTNNAAENNIPETDDPVKVPDCIDNTQDHDTDAGNVDVEHSREGEFRDVAEKDVPGMDDQVEDPGKGAKNDMPEIDNLVERHDGTNDGFGTEAKQTDDQYPGVDSADAAMKPGHTIGNGVPKTNALVEGSDEINIDAEHPRVDNVDEVQKPGDTAGNEVPKGADMPILNGGIDIQQPSEAASSPEEEASNIVEKDQSKTADMPIHNGALEIQQSEDNSDRQEKPGDTAEKGMPETADMSVCNWGIENQQPSEDNSSPIQKPCDIAEKGLPQTAGMPTHNGVMEIQQPKEDVFDNEEKPSNLADLAGNGVPKAADMPIHNGLTEIQEAREDNSGQEVKAGNMTENGVPNMDGMPYHHDAIQDDRCQDVHNGGMGIQQPREDNSGNEGNSSVVGGSVVPELDDSVEIHDIQSNKGDVTNNESIQTQHSREVNSTKDEEFGILVGKVVPEREDMNKGFQDIKNDEVHDINTQRTGEDNYAEEEKPNDRKDVYQTDEIAEDQDIESDKGLLDVESEDKDAQTVVDIPDREGESGDGAIDDNSMEEVTEEYAPSKSDEVSAVSKEDTEGRHPYIIEGARVLDLVRDFASRGLALYMSARGCDEQEEVGKGRKEVDLKPGRNHENITEQGLDLLMEAMSGSIGI